MTAIKNVSQKKRGRPATGERPKLIVRVDPDVLECLDAAAAEANPPVRRSDVARHVLQTWAAKRGA